MNGYIIPPPMETRKCIKILAPRKKYDQPHRCDCETTPEDLEQAKRLTSRLTGQTIEEKESTMRRIILLRVCKNTHRRTLDIADPPEILKSLVEAYRESHVEAETSKLQFTQTSEELFEQYHPGGHRSTVGYILSQQINKEQDDRGSIYIFGWPRASGFLKIGYARACPEKRVNTWQLCHPEATPMYQVELAFPERMESLVHAELAGKRCRLRKGCPRCGRRHTEWFAITFEEAQQVVRDWCEVAASPLYMEDRTLSQQWALIIGSLTQVNASILSQQLKKHPLSKMSRSHSISQQPETSRLSSEGIKFNSCVSSARHPEKGRQIDGLAAKLDDLTIDSQHDEA